MHQLIQIIGALLILAGFVLAQFRLLDPQSLWYLVVNLILLLVMSFSLAFFLLELVWAIVSAWGLIQLARGRSPRAAH